jgi:hypothetical protein
LYEGRRKITKIVENRCKILKDIKNVREYSLTPIEEESYVG